MTFLKKITEPLSYAELHDLSGLNGSFDYTLNKYLKQGKLIRVADGDGCKFNIPAKIEEDDDFFSPEERQARRERDRANYKEEQRIKKRDYYRANRLKLLANARRRHAERKTLRLKSNDGV